MKLYFYLIVDEHGSISSRKNRPDARIGQVVIPMRLDIPDTVFRPQMAQAIEISVPEQHVVQPVVETFELGTRGICSACGQEIEFNGEAWQHLGELQPRHPATPR